MSWAQRSLNLSLMFLIVFWHKALFHLWFQPCAVSLSLSFTCLLYLGKTQARWRVIRCTITHNIPHVEKWEQRIGQTKDKEDLMSCRSSKFSVSLYFFSWTRACTTSESSLPLNLRLSCWSRIKSILEHDEMDDWMQSRLTGTGSKTQSAADGSAKSHWWAFKQVLIDRCNIRRMV